MHVRCTARMGYISVPVRVALWTYDWIIWCCVLHTAHLPCHAHHYIGMIGVAFIDQDVTECPLQETDMIIQLENLTCIGKLLATRLRRIVISVNRGRSAAAPLLSQLLGNFTPQGMVTMSSNHTRLSVMRLYKDILRQHRFALPPKHRELGDRYVRRVNQR